MAYGEDEVVPLTGYGSVGEVVSSAPGAVERVVSAIGRGAAEGYGPPPAMTPETEKFYQDYGIFNKPGESSPIRSLNEAVIRPVVAGFNVLGGAASAVARGAGAGVEEAARSAGVEMPERMGRDVTNLITAGLADAGSRMPSPRAPRGARPTTGYGSAAEVVERPGEVARLPESSPPTRAMAASEGYGSPGEVVTAPVSRSLDPFEGWTPDAPATLRAPTAAEVTPQQLSIFRTLEGSPNGSVSPAGALGEHQIMPGTGRQYGFTDMARLQNDPAYNAQAAQTVISDLSNRFNGNLRDMLVGYNAGPGRAAEWIRTGRDPATLPAETQAYLAKAQRLGYLDGKASPEVQLAQAEAAGRGGGVEPPRGPGGGEPPPVDAPPLFESRVAQGMQKNVAAAADELLTEGKVIRDPSRLLSDQILELLQTNRLSTDQIRGVLDAHKVPMDAFATLWRTDIKRAAQDLQTLSAIEQRLKAIGGELPKDAGIDYALRGESFWQRLNNIRRGLMVSQLSTAARNATTQVGRIGLDVLQQGMDTGLRNMFEAFGARPTTPAPDAVGALMKYFRPLKTRAEVDAVLSRFPLHNDRMFQNFMSDISNRTGGMGGAIDKVLTKAETGTRLLNFANRFQEFVVRRAAFAARLDRELAASGLSLEKVIAENRIGAIPKEAMDSAVKHALDMTFSKTYSPFAPGWEGTAGNFVRFVNGTPLTLVMPFPRFMANSIEFLFEHSPAGFLKLLSPVERAKIAAGDTSAISKATLGSAMLLAGYALRGDPNAGEKWHEWRLPDGRTVDLRPYNPYAAYLFIGDMVRRTQEGTLDRVTSLDAINGLLASQFRAGLGLYSVDTVINGLMGNGELNAEKASRMLMTIPGGVAAQFLTPLNEITNVLAEFQQSPPYLRTDKEGPFVGVGEGPRSYNAEGQPIRLPMVGMNLGPAMKAIPGVESQLPPVQRPTRGEPIVKQEPLLKATTGISINEAKNPVEKELDRLNVKQSEVQPSLGNPTADRYVDEKMGPLVEQIITPFVGSQSYQQAPDPLKKEMLNRFLDDIRQGAIKMATAEHPEMFTRLKLEHMPKFRQWILEQATGRKPGEMVH